jgi:hypothetical protein
MFAAIGALQDSILGTGEFQAINVSKIEGMLSLHAQKLSAFDFVFGNGWLSIIGVLFAFIFQGLRLYITTQIAPMVEMEKRSGYTPRRSNYLRFVSLHRIVVVLAVFVSLSFFLEIFELMTASVLVFESR